MSPGNKWAVHELYDMLFSFNIPLCVDCTVLTYVTISTFPHCTGTMFVAGTTAVMTWSPALVSAMPLPCGCYVEEGGYPVVSTLGKFCWVNFILLLTVVLPAP